MVRNKERARAARNAIRLGRSFSKQLVTAGPARPAPRPWPACCNALPIASSGFAFRLTGYKVRRWRDTHPSDRSSVVLDTIASA
jgi:hypothetical protein